MKLIKALLACLLLSAVALGAQNFGFGTMFTLTNDSALSGLTFDIPSKGSWDSQVVVAVNSAPSGTYQFGVKVSRDMGLVYNIKRYLGGGFRIASDFQNNLRMGGQAQVGIKIPGFVEGFTVNIEVGFGLSSSKAGKLRGGAFVGAGSSYSF